MASLQVSVSKGFVGKCSAYMVSAEVFEECVLPEVARIGESLGTVRLHSCGRCDHFIGLCSGIANLGSIDVGGGNSVARIRHALGADFLVSIAPLPENLTNRWPDGLLAWTQRVPDENHRGGPLAIVCHREAEYNVAAIRCVVELVREH
jgi:hypothetical protein